MRSKKINQNPLQMALYLRLLDEIGLSSGPSPSPWLALGDASGQTRAEFVPETMARLSVFAFLREVRRRLVAALATLLLSASLPASDFPEPHDSEPGGVRPMPPTEALAALRLPEGFEATLFAAEPEVRNPIALAWDSRGRMWVAENYTYAERQKRFDLSLRDRVLILEDKDWDGVAETRTVFTDQVQMLTSVEVGRGGVWLMCPPQLLFVPDADGDDVPDGPARVVLDGFTVAEANYHNFANGLRFAPDGWLYGRCGHSCPGLLGKPGTPESERVPMKGGIWRYHPEREIVEVLTHGTTNPWGHDWNEQGELFFINTVTGHLWHLIHGAHLVDSNVTNPLIYDRLDTIADHYHYDRGASWSDSRDGKASDFGGGHAHIGMMIYQAEQWPEAYRGRLFTLNMHGRRANQERLERNGSGYVGRHEPDFFLSDDPWFRGLEISVGPDGSAFVLDWSDTGECHEHSGVHRNSGRIFRISHGTPEKPETPFAWRRPWPEPDLASPDEHARALAVRGRVQFSPIDAITGPLPHARYPELDFNPAAMAREESSAFVRLNLASALQRLPLERRAELALALLAHDDADDPFLPHLVWFGISPLAKHDPEALVRIAAAQPWPKVVRWIARSLAPRPEALEALLSANASDAVLEGIDDAFKGLRKAPKPANWDEVAKTSSSPLVRELGVVFGDGRALDEVKALALDPKGELAAREAALATLVEARPPDLREICEQLLETRGVNLVAARGLALFDDPAIGERLAKAYRRFPPGDRPAVLDVLASRPAFARALLDHLDESKIPRRDLSAFHARQILGFGDEALAARLAETWGELRDSGEDKAELIAAWKAKLTPEVLAAADLPRGRALSAICTACHTLYGEGPPDGGIGPDLTGSGRADLGYLLENILDPGAVVPADYRMTMLTLEDGRVLTGVVASRDERTLSLRTLAGTVPIDLAEVVKTDLSPVSMMPEGLLQGLDDDQVRDLLAYLMHPVQVPLP
jgi:putative membrane-bound dehydrogenase-like protein